MARKQKKEQVAKMSIVKTLLFKDDKDEDLLAMVNTYSALRPAFKPKSLIREILLRILPVEIDKYQERNKALKTD